jgi:hypothetical protein
MGAAVATEEVRAVVTYQVTAGGVVVAVFGNGYDATQYATRIFTSCDYWDKVVTVKRSDGCRP